MTRKVRIAFEGCCHSELDKIYNSIRKLEIPIDLLIIGGDFQAVRNYRDLKCMAVPEKYLRLGDFADYYSGKKLAPVLTIFVGGNHEASNYLWELYHGGWVAPNIYYAGAANVLDFAGIRIGLVSGTWSEAHYNWGHHERVPYYRGAERSAYHIRQYDIQRLYNANSSTTSKPVDIMVSHDWPQGIEKYGDLNALLTRKPFFKADIDNEDLGSPPNMLLLRHLKPQYWISAHLHVKYTAIYKHDTEISEAAPGFQETRFLALDKCLPRRQFLQVLEFQTSLESDLFSLKYDPDWLAVIRATNSNMPLDRDTKSLYSTPEERNKVVASIADEREWIEKNLCSMDKLYIPLNFELTAPIADHSDAKNIRNLPSPLAYNNNQTAAFCKLLQIENKIFRPDLSES
ncbi:DBR1-domain-containing protein [Lipomyces oligophaga]|uniref:DBR1-domain-containing protein n=1 Tax=Lipomyces oligophaga TaxID=45792 RepID=UPI0034CEE275